MSEHYEVPVIVSIAYVVIIFGIQALMKHRNPFDLKQPLAVWNSSLAIFSMIGAYYVVPAVLTVWLRDGFSAELCSFESEQSNPWVYFFCLSKIPEFVDTLFIVLRKSNLRFLHWYHHVATMWYCWHAWAVQVENGGMFAAMNLIVHSVMYSYYAATALGQKFSNSIRQSITNIQILQMVFGTAFCVHNLVRCADHPLNLWLGLGMYISYAYLFIVLWLVEYGSKKAAAKTSAPPSSQKLEKSD